MRELRLEPRGVEWAWPVVLALLGLVVIGAGVGHAASYAEWRSGGVTVEATVTRHLTGNILGSETQITEVTFPMSPGQTVSAELWEGWLGSVGDSIRVTYLTAPDGDYDVVVGDPEPGFVPFLAVGGGLLFWAARSLWRLRRGKSGATVRRF